MRLHLSTLMRYGAEFTEPTQKKMLRNERGGTRAKYACAMGAVAYAVVAIRRGETGLPKNDIIAEIQKMMGAKSTTFALVDDPWIPIDALPEDATDAIESYEWRKRIRLGGLVIDLNDKAEWSRERIADLLEELDKELSFIDLYVEIDDDKINVEDLLDEVGEDALAHS